MYENSLYVFTVECFSYCLMCLVTSVVSMKDLELLHMDGIYSVMKAVLNSTEIWLSETAAF